MEHATEPARTDCPPTLNIFDLQIMNLVQLATPKNCRSPHHHGRPVISFINPAARGPDPKPAHRPSGSQSACALRLGHVHLKVRDLDCSLPFYTGLLGLRLTERTGRYAFLAIGSEHHSIAIEEIGAWAVNPSRRAVGIAHIAFEVPDRATLGRMRRKLAEGHVPFISRNNGISWAMRLKDPDRNEVEIYLDRRHSPSGARLWGGRWYGPLDIEDEPTPTVSEAA